MDIKILHSNLDKLKGRKQQTISDVILSRKELRDINLSIIRHEKAQAVIREVSLNTQKQLQYHISDITSMALDAIFPKPYQVSLEFVERRNKTECDIFFVKGEDKFVPKLASGGGAVDVAAFALRIASWSMSFNKSDNVFLMDEPLRYLSTNFQDKASQLIKEISEKLRVQFIIVTHEPILGMYADRIFETSIKRGVTTVKQR